MPSRDADAKILEQFLRTMAPPAALTATYRQQVVRASLNARSRLDTRRRLQRLVAGTMIIGCAVFLPVCFFAASIQSGYFAMEDGSLLGTQSPASGTVFSNAEIGSPISVPGRHATADSYELSVIRSQFRSRFEVWSAAQRGDAW